MNQQLGGCLRDFRNKPFPVRAKIEYYQNAITVSSRLVSSYYMLTYVMGLSAKNVIWDTNLNSRSSTVNMKAREIRLEQFFYFQSSTL